MPLLLVLGGGPHGGKTKNDRIDSHKIAALLRGGNLPFAYVYPRKMRPTRDLLRRRLFFARKRGELLAHIQNTNTQYNLPPLEQRPDKTSDRGVINVHLKWAFSEAAALFLRRNAAGQKYFARLEKKHGKGKALSTLAAKLGRAVYYMMLCIRPFELQRFVAA